MQGWLGSDQSKGTVKFGNKPCEIYNYASIMTWLCIIPEGLGDFGTVPVVVESYGHPSDPFGNIFHYQGPVVTSISPNYISPGQDPVFEITGKNFGARAEDKHLFLYWNMESVLDEESIHQREYSGNGNKCIVQESDDSWKTFHERFTCRVMDEAFLEDYHIFQVYLAIGRDDINIDWEDFEPTAGEETFAFSNYQVSPKNTAEALRVCHEHDSSVFLSGQCRCPPGLTPSESGLVCEPCPANTYSNNSSYGAGVSCTSCPAGSLFSPSLEYMYHSELGRYTIEASSSFENCTCGSNSTMAEFEVGAGGLICLEVVRAMLDMGAMRQLQFRFIYPGVPPILNPLFGLLLVAVFVELSIINPIWATSSDPPVHQDQRLRRV